MPASRYYAVALLSATIVAVELIWTRIFSAEFFYTFAFLILSLAILGLGLGALTIRLFKILFKEEYVGGYLTISGLLALLTPPLVIDLQIKFSKVFSEPSLLWKMLLMILLLSSVFYFAGLALTVLFRKYSKNIARLYMFDLIGASIGVFLALWLMNQFGTPFAVFLATIPIFIAAILTQPKWMKLFPLIFLIGIFFSHDTAVEQLSAEREERAPVIYTHWDAMSKLKLYDFSDLYRGINIDNIANSPVYGFDGDYNVPDSEKQWSIDVSYLIQQFDSAVFLSLGAGGGGDVLQALLEGAGEVHAVEVNGHINKMMTEGDLDGYIPEAHHRVDTIINDSTGDTTINEYDKEIMTLAEFSGYIYDNPKVKVVTEDARTYVRRFENKFDVIYSLSSNTWAALASGAFALAENYIFTTEAYEDYWQALSDSGFMMMEHQFYMPRLVSEVKQALFNQGVTDIEKHLAVYDLPKMRRNMMLLSKRPLDDSLRYYAFGPLTDDIYDHIHLLYPPHDSVQDNLINRIMVNGWEAEADSVPIDISPVSDNRPFVAQLGLMKNFDFASLKEAKPYEFYGFPLSKLVMIIILLIVIVAIIPLNLLPYAISKEKLKAAPWIYFFLIGFSFMAFEIVLMQKYTMFIGASVYAIAAVLMTLLISSGIGSRFSEKISDSLPFLMIALWFLLDQLFFGFIVSLFDGFTIGWRVLVSCIVIAPLGFFMGMPFPKGARYVGDLVDWGFAVNGAASVLGATGILLIAINYGFTVSLLIAVIGYLLAFMLIVSMKKQNHHTV